MGSQESVVEMKADMNVLDTKVIGGGSLVGCGGSSIYPYTTWPTNTLPYIAPTSEAWVAFDEDQLELVAFPSEIEALRYAVDHGMRVKRIQWGAEIHAQVGADG